VEGGFVDQKLEKKIEQELSLVKRRPGENDLDLAERLYNLRMETIGLRAGGVLCHEHPLDPYYWNNLDYGTREGWVIRAKKIK
jgi:hypothetical protein